MTSALRLWPLLTATHRYDKSLSTRGRGAGSVIEAPILAYLIETSQGRILYDVGCDYAKIASPTLRERHYAANAFGVPSMEPEQRLPAHLARLGLRPQDVDLVILGHLHFDHAGGLGDVGGAEVHVQREELAAARSGDDPACFPDEIAGADSWTVVDGEYAPVTGLRTVSTPGHTAGHMSLWIELPRGAPVVLCGDAADLRENLDDEVAPGLCWHDRHEQAVDSIRRLKRLACAEGAELWPNHDLAFWRGLRRFPQFHQ